MRHFCLLLLACLLIVSHSACSRSASEPVSRDGQTYGQTSVPFRQRWWHYQERGLSWARGGYWERAESDLRQCLRIRQSDHRRARTYGMRFVQCFANRELGAVLIEQGRLDEAQVYLTRSMEQEPSAKAKALLERLASGQQAVKPTALRLDREAQSLSLPEEVTVYVAPQFAIDAITAAGISGRLSPAGEAVLWRLDANNAVQHIDLAEDGLFTLAPDVGKLHYGWRLGESVGEIEIVKGADQPRLRLLVPEDGHRLQDERLWVSYRLVAGSPLQSLTVTDGQGLVLHTQELSGLQSAGTFACQLTSGEQQLTFTGLCADGRTVVEQRRYTVSPRPDQALAVRAAALLTPLNKPRHGADLAGLDRARYHEGLLTDGRFRYRTAEGDAVRQLEVDVVDAGYVDRTTAARAGRQLQARYVVATTMRKGKHDAECYLRVISVASSEVLARADVYGAFATAADRLAFFHAVAGSLRQCLPVVSAGLQAGDEGRPVLAAGRRSGVVKGMRYFNVDAVAKQLGGQDLDASFEVLEVSDDEAILRPLAETQAAAIRQLVSE